MAGGILDLCSVELWSGSSSNSIDSHELLGSMNHALERMARMAVTTISSKPGETRVVTDTKKKNF